MDKIRPILLILCMGSMGSVVKAGSLRISDGRDAKDSEFVFVVQIEMLDLNFKEATSFCTGTLILPTWAISAAHCMTSFGTPFLEFNIRHRYPHGSPLKENVIRKIVRSVSPRYSDSRRNLIRDVALLETEPIMISKFARISALDFTTLYGQQVTLVGSGLANQGDQRNVAQNVGKPLQVIDNAMLKQCDMDQSYPSICIVQRCSGISAMCTGDSGAPVFHPSGIVAIFVRTTGRNVCTNKDYRLRFNLVVAVPISPFVDWIASVTANSTTRPS